MTLTLAQLDGRLARRVGNLNTNNHWDSDDRLQALTEACEEAWPFFFVVTRDFTTYTGASSIAENTAEIAVPSTFLATASTTSVAAPGLISAIQVRETGTTTYTEPLDERWFFVEHGVRIDDLSVASPKIRFANPFNMIFEMRLYGGMPIVCPSTPSAAVPGTDTAGFVSWLLVTASAKLYEMRETSNEEDQGGYGRRRLLAEQRAKELRAQYRMTLPHLTAFKWSN